MQIAPTAPELQGSQCTASSARFAEFEKFVVAKTNNKRQIVRSHLLRQEIEDQRCMHLGSEEFQPRRRERRGAIYFPTEVAAAMRDLELVNVLSLIHLAKSWKIPMYLGGDWNGHIGKDHGGDDIQIGPFTSTTPTIPKGFVFARTFADEDLNIWKTVFTHWSGEERGGTIMETGTRTMWFGLLREPTGQFPKSNAVMLRSLIML